MNHLSGLSNRGLSAGLAALAFLGLAAVSGAAQAADVCVALDEQRDTLSPEDRAATRTFLIQTLEENGQRVVASGCQTTYTVYHLRLGSSVTVVLSTPADSRKLKVGQLEDVPNAYSQLVKSLLTGKPLGVETDTITRTNVTDSQVAPNRVEADSLLYLRLGYGAISASGLQAGPAIGFGYRYELDRIALDASFLNFVITKKDSSYNAVSGTWLRLGANYYFDPFASSSLYAGAGIGWGVGGAEVDSINYSNSGIDFSLSAGYEMLRASTVRIFLQLDANLPSYAIKGSRYDPVTTTYSSDSIYAPSFSLSLGLGFGKSKTIAVKELH